MATDGGPKHRRPRKPPVVVEREVEDVEPDSESPEQLRRSAWSWFRKDELAADVVVAGIDVIDVKAAAPEIVAPPTVSVADVFEVVDDVVAFAPADNVVAAEDVREEPTTSPVDDAAITTPVVDAATDGAADTPAEATTTAPAEPSKRKRGPRKKPPPEPITWFRARSAAFFRARRSVPSVASVVGDEHVSAVFEDATKTSGSVARAHLKGVLEALIFASEHPLSSRVLAQTAKAEHRVVTSLLAELMDEYRGRGVRLDEVAGGYVFRTSPAFAPFVREHVAKKPVKMTRAQVETLAIIAYKQPITRPEVDDVRGVDSGAILKSLLERELVRILGKKEEAGRPLLYGTTPQFLEFFGLKALGDLPTLREFTELTDESKRVYEREMGEDPLDAAIALTNMQSAGTEIAKDRFGTTTGGLMGGEGEFRSPTTTSADPQQVSQQSGFDETTDDNITSDAEQGEEATMKNDQTTEIEDLIKRTSSEVDEQDEDLDEDEEDEDEGDEDEEDEEDEDDEDEDEDEDEDDEDFDDEDDEDDDDDDEEDDEDDEDDDEDEEDDDEEEKDEV